MQDASTTTSLRQTQREHNPKHLHVYKLQSGAYSTWIVVDKTECDLILKPSSPFLLHLTLKADQPFTLSSVFYRYPISSTVWAASKISPRGSSIRHAKVKTSYCHLEWLNVYQGRRNTLTYGIWTWHPLPVTLKEYLYLHQYACVAAKLLNNAAAACHPEGACRMNALTHRERMSSFITCSR